MRTVFADSFYFFALANPNDPAHGSATTFTATYGGLLVTTAWVLVEVADGWAKPTQHRSFFTQLLAGLKANPAVRVIACIDQHLQEGVELYDRRSDKEWSLTDCISFIIMQQEGITEALTGDKHFEQAGFVTLLK